MKLSVHLVVWNGAKYIPFLFESLRKQSCKDWFLYIVDNDSKDNTVELIKRELENFPISYKFIVNSVNNGFAGGHNQAYQDTDSEYFLLLNQDMYLKSDCLQNMVDFLDNHHKVAAVSPRLMKWNFAKVAAVGLEESFSNQIDALGLKIFRNRRVIEQYTQYDWNEVKNNFLNNELEVFGASGAFPMLRRSIIDKVAFSGGQFLDESYHAYKEDVDLSYRLQEAGFKSFIILDTVAYHDRSGAGPRYMHDFAAIKNKKNQSSWVRYHSYKNHLRTLYKNEFWQNFILDFPWILWYELKKFLYLLLFDRSVIYGLKEVWQSREDLKNKRAQIKIIRNIKYSELRKWWK